MTSWLARGALAAALLAPVAATAQENSIMRSFHPEMAAPKTAPDRKADSDAKSKETEPPASTKETEAAPPKDAR